MARRNWVMRAAALVAAVVVLGGAGWLLWGLWGGEPEIVAVSPEAAEAAEEKLDRLRERREEVALSGVEISSLLRYRAPAAAVEMVRDPSVRFAGDTLVLSGRIPLDRLPAHPDLDQVRGFLPDTAAVEVVGRLRHLDAGRAALEVRGVEIAGLPVPERFYPEVLGRVGRRDVPGLTPNAIALALPAGVGAARIEGGFLILSP